MAACPTTACAPVFTDPRVDIQGTAFSTITQQCKPEQGILYLTDDAGLLTTADSTQGAFLSAGNPTATITPSEYATHWNQCGCTFWDMECFFSQSKRPSTIIVGLVMAGETLSDAFTRLTKCPLCALTVQVATCKTDGTTWIDTAEYSAFTSLVNNDTNWHHHGMTYEASTAFADYFETGSFAAGHADQDQEWTVADVGCRFQYEMSGGECVPSVDADGNAIQIPYYLNSGLTAAALDAQHSVDDADYNYTVYAEPVACHTGRYLDETTGTFGDLTTYDDVDLSASDGLTQLTGMDNSVGCPLTGAARHLNGFVRLSDGSNQSVRYVSGLYINGKQYGDTFYKKKAVDAEVVINVAAFKDQFGSTVTARGLAAESNSIATVLDKWIGKGVINPVAQDWGIPDVKINGQGGNGEGYYIDYPDFDELNAADINCRSAAVISYCFEVNSPQHGSRLQVCDLPPLVEGS